MPAYSREQWMNLIEQTSNSTPTELGPHAWYLIVCAALSTSPSPELLAEFFTHLTEDGPFSGSAESKQRLSLQLRDVLLKQVTLTGAPQVLMAMTPLAAAEGSPQEKAKESQLSEKWKNIDREQIHARGVDTIHSIYGHDLLHNRIFPLWGVHTQDVQFMELFAVYGMYLSDFEVLTPLETELVVFVTISCLGLGTGPALWHLRGLGRLLGARGSDESASAVRIVKDQLRSLKVAIMDVVEFVGEEYLRKAKLDTWSNVGDVVRVLGGWGEDAPEVRATTNEKT